MKRAYIIIAAAATAILGKAVNVGGESVSSNTVAVVL